ncbi:hypothetical protein [Bacillus sonorensis]|uniref:hypothetical protein n=1 Tax=Bacillus sonorensis TaxID=119858 RepID=UPI001ABF10F7|nr:hypothetical protein [Bacillus sonorensis]
MLHQSDSVLPDHLPLELRPLSFDRSIPPKGRRHQSLPAAFFVSLYRSPAQHAVSGKPLDMKVLPISGSDGN